MAEVMVRVGGRGYPLRCAAGEEARLEALAAILDAKAASLGSALAATGEARLLLMAGILVAEELEAARRAAPAVDMDRLAALTTRAETLADALESA